MSLASVNKLLVLDKLEFFAPDPAFIGGVWIRKLSPGLVKRETFYTDLVVLAITRGQRLYEVT